MYRVLSISGIISIFSLCWNMSELIAVFSISVLVFHIILFSFVQTQLHSVTLLGELLYLNDLTWL